MNKAENNRKKIQRVDSITSKLELLHSRRKELVEELESINKEIKPLQKRLNNFFRKNKYSIFTPTQMCIMKLKYIKGYNNAKIARHFDSTCSRIKIFLEKIELIIDYAR